MILPDAALFLEVMQDMGIKYAWFQVGDDCYTALEIGSRCIRSWDEILTKAKVNKKLGEAVDIINNFLKEERYNA